MSEEKRTAEDRALRQRTEDCRSRAIHAHGVGSGFTTTVARYECDECRADDFRAAEAEARERALREAADLCMKHGEVLVKRWGHADPGTRREVVLAAESERATRLSMEILALISAPKEPG